MSAVPEVTVVIPTRGFRRFLPLTLAAALAQERVTVEVVVVDDGSADRAAQELTDSEEPRLRVLRHDARRGVAAARNTGLAAVGSEWIAFLDDDDLWSPRKLRTQLDAIDAEDASFAYGAAIVIDENGDPIHSDEPPPSPSDLPAALLPYLAMPAPGSNLLVRTALVRDLGGFDERARFDDWDMWIRVAEAASGARCPEILTAYRRHKHNRILTIQDQTLPGLRYLAAKHRALTRKYDADFDEVACRRWLAWTYRRAGQRMRASLACVETALTCRTPSDLVRAALVPFGEWAIYDRPRRVRTPPPAPRWLEEYRRRPPTFPLPDR